MLKNRLAVTTILIACFLLLNNDVSKSQVTLESGDYSLDIGGRLTTYYNYRFYPEDEDDRSKNRFTLKDARIDLEGDNGNGLEFRLKYDFGSLLVDEVDPEDPPMKDAFIEYNGLAVFDVILGFTKVPYSRSSIMSFRRSPFMQRSEMIRGEAFGRRDVGLQLRRDFWERRIYLHTGIFTGMGEQSLTGDNDPSGKLEYVARVEASYPRRYRYREVDLDIRNVPQVSVGANARYFEKNTDTDINYGLFTVDGERYLYGFDVSVQFKGLSADFEMHQMQVFPNDEERLLGLNTDHFRAGGFIAQLNYHWKDIQSVFAVRYDEFNPNDLIEGNTIRNLSFAYNFMFDEQNSFIKVHYWHRLDKDATGEPWHENQIRVGYVYEFF